MPSIGPHPMLGFLPGPLKALADLACDLHWSWSHATDALWAEIEPRAWQRTRNPVLVLQNAPRERLARLARDAAFVDRVAAAEAARHAYLTRRSWFEQQYPANPLGRVAYFSMEFGITDALPMYSGGLGALAGDHLKTASDLGIPLVAVGLFFHEGYFRQVIDAEGWQREFYPNNSPTSMPVRPLLDDDGAPLRIALPLPGRELLLRVWHACVGRVSLYLLDSDDPLNSPADRGITAQLYGGDRETRFTQEACLGIGGWRLLQALGLEVDVCHLNEGHAAFVTSERARSFMAAHGVTAEQALLATRAGNVFTTHTPVAAAFDVFPVALLDKYGAQRQDKDVADIRRAMARLLGTAERGGTGDRATLNMAYIAARTCARMNGVSRLHGEVSRQIFAPLFPRWPLDEVPVGHVTNAVHMPTWDSAAADSLWSQACGKDRWCGSPEGLGARIAAVDDATLWSLRGEQRRELVAYARARLALQLGQRGASPGEIDAAHTVLDPNVLTIGFARRFTEYKRPDLLLRDAQRLLRLTNDPARPVQIIVAGKAHPHDQVGKLALQRWAAFAHSPAARARAVLLEDYDLGLAQELVRGVDVWINTPRRPWEASGTSGMKVLVNGGLNLSSLDGWWAEAYAPELGWALGDREVHSGAAFDERDAGELYRLLETEIVPAYYDRDAEGIPRDWVARIRASMSVLTPQFSSTRMLAEYVRQLYVPAAADYRRRARDGAQLARTLDRWLESLRAHWHEIHWGRYEVRPADAGLTVTLQVYLGDLAPEAVRVQLYAQRAGTRPAECHALERREALPGSVSGFRYEASIRTERPASDFAPRVVPAADLVAVPAEAAFIRWYPE
jgi:starch phosphorylase